MCKKLTLCDGHELRVFSSQTLSRKNSKVLRWQIICPQGMFREGCADGPNSVVIVIRQYVPLCVPVCHARRFI